ncbi:hypothetical protein C8P66_1395 [Humitalea rosea]|uniref:Cytokinin riboside 5'-monophosphate phosphoribohydrolase n=1 Tax=Humitalea rosea TaxID=990373 RepID=A0A2W7HWE5_9PROT|nr:TIGR00730 family Rossman fold protein [Humitalea rosea]PZW37854.1 hypothetical protein C8P66_1395 [Humitalea rosea]
MDVSAPPTPLRRVCVFCGASPGLRPIYAEAARALGQAIAARGLGLVYGGGHVGLMGIVADAALAAGAPVTGVIPEALLRREVGHGALTDLRVVATMHERKAMMADLAGGFIVLPGGFGTLEEAAEILTWSQLGIHRKGLVFLDIDGFWSPLIHMFDHMGGEGFLRPHVRELAVVAETPEAALDALAGFAAPPTESWLTPAQT